MSPFGSPVPMLVLHAVRLTGVGDPCRLAGRFSLPLVEVEELLLDYQAHGWVSWAEFAGTGGWSLTEAGRTENTRQLAQELSACGALQTVTAAHAAFLPLNTRFLQACTNWQIRPQPGEPLAANDHTDFRWDDRVIYQLSSLGRKLDPLCAQLSSALARFDGYGQRYDAAIRRAARGESSYVDAIDRDSCHTVWFEVHEDLVATLGLSRGQ